MTEHRGSQGESQLRAIGRYAEILEAFGAREKPPAESVAHLVSLGYRRGQARNAVYRFRQRRPEHAETRNTDR